MEVLLQDLLDLSRIVQLPIKLVDIDLKSVVQQQCDTLEAAIREADATINIAEHLHTVHANERLLSEGLLNLMTNALRYREPSRPLRIDIFTRQSKLSTSIHVKDTDLQSTYIVVPEHNSMGTDDARQHDAQAWGCCEKRRSSNPFCFLPTSV